MIDEQNWARNYRFTARRIHRPGSIDEVRRLVAAARQVRAIGTRHSFNGIADSEGDLIDLGGLDPRIEIDRERSSVTVGAGTAYGTLAARLQAEGYALHNMGSLPHISVAGATATGTHGSGDDNGSLSTAVRGLELVTAGGDLVEVARGTAGFEGMVVGLGAFGIVTRLTLDIQPSFVMQQDCFVDLPWRALLEQFEAVSAAAYSVSVMTKWTGSHAGRLWLKTRLEDGRARAVTAAHLGAAAAPGGAAVPAGVGPDEGLTPFGGVPGPWSERLPHFRHDRGPGVGDQIQSEYMLPRANAAAALAALRAIGPRIDALLHMTELRTVAADDLWLSGAYGHPTVAIHFTWKQEAAAVDALTREIEAMLLPLGGRPHWGKLIHAPAAQLAPLYPRLAEFRELARRRDPDGKFRNRFLGEHVFG